MKNYLFIILLAAFVLSAYNTQAQKETRNVPEFTKVSFGVSGNLYIKEGRTQSLVLEGDDLDEIETEVSGGKLRIKKDNNGWNWNSKKIDVYITITKLEGLSVGGSGKVYGESKFKTGDLDLSVSGSGDVELEVEADEIDAGISGSGDIELKGSAQAISMSISGSGKMDAEDLMVGTCKIRISGSGSCRIHATEEIDARISGSGSVYYAGDPNKVYNHSSGSGKIRKI